MEHFSIKSDVNKQPYVPRKNVNMFLECTLYFNSRKKGRRVYDIKKYGKDGEDIRLE